MSDDPKALSKHCDESYRALLMRLPGIYAAGIRADEEGAPCEIHVLANSERNPKQIVRDVQSALFAAYGVDIDHRIVSVASMGENPLIVAPDVAIEEPAQAENPPEHESFRLRCKVVSNQMDDEGYMIRVILQYAGQQYEGVERCSYTSSQRMMATMKATLQAVQLFLGRDNVFQPVGVQLTQAGGISIVVTVVELNDWDSSCLLTGSSKQSEDGVVSVVRATLDAVNRSVGKLGLLSKG